MAVAFALRSATRLLSGEADFLRHGYTMYLALAKSLLHGDGLCLSPAIGCARRMPLYPLLIAPILVTSHVFPWLSLTQAAIGAATVWVGWKIALEIADRRAAAVAATCVALNPYAVVHDTGLQETVLFNLLIAVATYLLLRLRRSESATTALGAGSALGLAMLTSGRIEVFLFAAVAWVAWRWGSAPRFRLATLVALPVVLLAGGWTLRNLVVAGAPVLSTEVGKNLWVGNNERTFSRYPKESIDLSQAESFGALSPARKAALTSAKNEVERDRLERSWAVEFATAHPCLVAWRGARKVWSAFSAQLSPERGRALGLGYRMIFIPIHILAAIGLWRLRSDRQKASLLALFIGSFALTTAVFWAHTSHKSSIDVVLFACAASLAGRLRRPALEVAFGRLFSRARPSPLNPSRIAPDMVEMTARFRASRDVVARDVPDGMMLVNVQTGAAFKLNRVGGQVWRLIDGGRSVGDIVTELGREYGGVGADRIRRDVELLIEDLEKQGLVGRVGAP